MNTFKGQNDLGLVTTRSNPNAINPNLLPIQCGESFFFFLPGKVPETLIKEFKK